MIWCAIQIICCIKFVFLIVKCPTSSYLANIFFINQIEGFQPIFYPIFKDLLVQIGIYHISFTCDKFTGHCTVHRAMELARCSSSGFRVAPHVWSGLRALKDNCIGVINLHILDWKWTKQWCDCVSSEPDSLVMNHFNVSLRNVNNFSTILFKKIMKPFKAINEKKN